MEEESLGLVVVILLFFVQSFHLSYDSGFFVSFRPALRLSSVP